MKSIVLPNRQYASRHAQKGVGLIEVLVAVLVVSIGFLGVAGLQVMSLSTNNDAMARSMATVASYSILDAMRADRTNALASKYDGTVDGNKCPAADKTLAGQQLHQWCTELGRTLRDPTGKVTCTTEGDCTITITYTDGRSKEGDNQQVVTRAAL